MTNQEVVSHVLGQKIPQKIETWQTHETDEDGNILRTIGHVRKTECNVGVAFMQAAQRFAAK